MSRKETERTKLVQEKCATLLTQMLRDEDNKYCVDCDAKGPRWASWNLGVFLCIRCAGIHRNLGVHISRVKSVNLDSWTPEQVISLQQMGNSRARAVYEAQLPDGFRRPQTDTALESFIRAKYEHKKYLAREWVPPPPPKVDWAKEIDEELERQKRKKKAAQVGSALGLSTALNSSGGAGEKKPSSLATAKSSPLPAPLPKPKPGQCGSSPKNQRSSAANAASNNVTSLDQSNDLLGLASPTKPIAAPASSMGGSQDLNNDSFSGFLSAPAANANSLSANGSNASASANAAAAESQQNSLAKEEEDFFNQSSVTLTGKDQSGKLTKDSILALYGSAPPNAGVNPLASNHNHLNAGQMPSAFGVQPFPSGPGNQAFAGGMGFMGLGGSMVMPSQPQPQHMHMQHQFMTPPNSTSMYNTPVMTAPNAFTSSGMHAAGGMGGTVDSTGAVPGFGANFPAMQAASGFPSQQMMSSGGGIMSTGSGQPNAATLNMNLMQSQPNMLGGMGMGLPAMGGGMPMATNQFQAPSGGNPAAAGTGNLNQQFGNLNIGNVWQ